MRKAIFAILFICFFLSSCVDFITIVDGRLYYDFDALISYELYTELHKADSINYSKPIFLQIKKKRDSE